MAARAYSQFKERKTTAPKGGAAAPRQGTPLPKGGPDRTAAWPTPKPTWKSSFNRGTSMPVTKTTAKKHGITA